MSRLRGAAAAIDEAVAPVFAVLDELAEQLPAAPGPLTVESLTAVREVARRTLQEDSGWVAGTGYVAAPDAVADMPLWIEWWLAGPSGSHPLRVNLDPRLPDFYDYTSSEWFRLPRDTGATSVTGPYLDVRGHQRVHGDRVAAGAPRRRLPRGRRRRSLSERPRAKAARPRCMPSPGRWCSPTPPAG